jgi:RNA-directed DNA polymerase
MSTRRQRHADVQRLAAALLQERCDEDAFAERAAAELGFWAPWINRFAFAAVADARLIIRELDEEDDRRDALMATIDTFLALHPRAQHDLLHPPPPPSHPALRPGLLHRWPIAPLASTGELAERLELSDGQLAWLADTRGLERTAPHERLRNYRYRWSPRRSGLPRLIESPKARLKEIQRWILREILDAIPPHDAAHGFTRSRSVHTHAALHADAGVVLRLDLRDFFASVTAGRIHGLFATVGYPTPVARALTGLVTNHTPVTVLAAMARAPRPGLVTPRHVLERRLAGPHLPQGAPSSPALANLAAYSLDRRLTGLAARFGLTYSRYADDLTFSGPGLGRRAASALCPPIEQVVRDEGFAVNLEKTMIRTRSQRQLVTGLVVNDGPRTPRDEYDRLRAQLHRLAHAGPVAAVAADGTRVRERLRGQIAWSPW